MTAKAQGGRIQGWAPFGATDTVVILDPDNLAAHPARNFLQFVPSSHSTVETRR